jgi:hypothetical protein
LALREALGTPPNSRRLGEVFQPHARGAILVAAVFDAFFSIYLKRTRDLMRIARAGGAVDSLGDLHPDLAGRLAEEATRTAERFLGICIRALDYCPPIDIQFGEFLRAIVTSDWNVSPDDPLGYRAEIIRAFRSRGIIPEGVTSYSEEAAGIEGLAVRVLGPPRDQEFLARMDPPAGDRFFRLGPDGKESANAIVPFDPRWNVTASDWEKGLLSEQDADILGEMAENPEGLAFMLHQAMNNTSLVTLFSYKGKNLLFPGDAQYGNWQNWVEAPRGRRSSRASIFIRWPTTEVITRHRKARSTR